MRADSERILRHRHIRLVTRQLENLQQDVDVIEALSASVPLAVSGLKLQEVTNGAQGASGGQALVATAHIHHTQAVGVRVGASLGGRQVVGVRGLEVTGRQKNIDIPSTPVCTGTEVDTVVARAEALAATIAICADDGNGLGLMAGNFRAGPADGDPVIVRDVQVTSGPGHVASLCSKLDGTSDNSSCPDV